MALTKQSIEEICSAVEYSKLNGVKVLRNHFPFGLKAALDFLNCYTGETLRKELMRMADLKEGTTFENPYFRIEIKAATSSLGDIMSLLGDSIQLLYPQLSIAEYKTFLAKLTHQIFPGASFEEVQELQLALIDKYFPEIQAPDA